MRRRNGWRGNPCSHDELFCIISPAMSRSSQPFSLALVHGNFIVGSPRALRSLQLFARTLISHPMMSLAGSLLNRSVAELSRPRRSRSKTAHSPLRLRNSNSCLMQELCIPCLTGFKSMSFRAGLIHVSRAFWSSSVPFNFVYTLSFVYRLY